MPLTNRGNYRIDLQGWPNLTTPKLFLLARDCVPLTRALNTLSQVDEYAGTGYDGGFGGTSRQTPANLAVSEDDSGNRSELTFDAPTFTGLLGPDPIAPFLALAEEITDDAGSHLIAFFPIATAGNQAAISAATEDSPGVFTSAGHGLSDDDLVYLVGFAGGTWDTLNLRPFTVDDATTDTFTLKDEAGNAIDTSALGTPTLTNAKVGRPIPMNGAAVTLTPDADGAIQTLTQLADA